MQLPTLAVAALVPIIPPRLSPPNNKPFGGYDPREGKYSLEGKYTDEARVDEQPESRQPRPRKVYEADVVRTEVDVP